MSAIGSAILTFAQYSALAKATRTHDLAFVLAPYHMAIVTAAARVRSVADHRFKGIVDELLNASAELFVAATVRLTEADVDAQ